MDEPPPNPHDRWSVHAKMHINSAANGKARVDVTLANEGFGNLPPIAMHVDWKPGMEPSDVEAHALLLLAQSAEYLKGALLALAVSKRM